MSEQPEESRAYHHGDLKNALVRAGLDLLIEQGVAALNLREVARRAGVSHAAPYRHFVDKEALLAAIAEDGFRQLEQTVAAAAASHNQMIDAFCAVGAAYVRFALEQPEVFRLMFSDIVGDRSLHPSLYLAAKASFHLLLGLIVEGQQRGDFIAGNPEALTASVWAMVHGLATLLVENQIGPGAQGVSPTHLDAETLIEFHLRQILASIQRRTLC